MNRAASKGGSLAYKNSNLSKSTFGTNTSITFNTNFTCPSDGYVRLARSSASGLYLVLIIGGVWVSRLSAANDFDSREEQHTVADIYIRLAVTIASSDGYFCLSLQIL